MNCDIVIFNYINDFAGRSNILDTAGIFLADYLPYLLVLFLLLLIIWPEKNATKNRRMVLLAIGAGLVARFIVKSSILLFYPRPRPYITLPLAHKLISMATFDNFQSFPSGHTIFFFAMATVIYYFNKKLSAVFFTFAGIIGLARIFVGVHWPSDILAGAILGILVGMATYEAYKRISKIQTRGASHS